MDKKLQNILLLIGGIATLLILALVIFLVAIPQPISQKQINKWRFLPLNGQKDLSKKVCPLFGAYPIFIKNNLSREKNKYQKHSSAKEFSLGMKIWNNFAKEENLPSPLFAKHSPELVKQYDTPTNQAILKRQGVAWPMIVVVKPFSPKDNGWAKRCENFYLGQKDFTPDSLAEVHFKVTSTGYYAEILVCEDSYEQAVGHGKYSMGIQKNQAALRMRKFRMIGIGAHELGHLLIGMKHPKHIGMLMDAEPTSTSISRQTKEIIRQKISVPCLKNSLFLKPNL